MNSVDFLGLGFVKYAQENLGCKKPGQAFRLGKSKTEVMG